MVAKVPKLSEEQGVAVDYLMQWNKQVQTMGGYAGCLSGDTVLRYSRGNRIGVRPITLRDMFLKFNGDYGSGRGAAQRWASDVGTSLYSFWPDASVKKNEVVAVFESGTKEVIRLNFTNRRHLILTPDHPIAIPGGEFVPASELSPGNEVLGVGDMRTKGVGRRPLRDRPHRVVVNLKYHPFGSDKIVVCNGISYSYTRVHRSRLVVEAAMNNVSYDYFVYCLKNDPVKSAAFKYLAQHLDVHHADEIPSNDNIENLEVIDHAEHPKRHDPGKHFNREYHKVVKVSAVRQAGREMTYDIQMKSPANNFEANGIFVHNTGKSTVIAELLRRLPGFAVCAYTGKAVDVLRRKGMSEAATIHSLAYRREVIEEPGGKLKEVYVLKDALGYGEDEVEGLIIDEASMVGKDLFHDLKTFDVRMICVGDHGQLEPIGDTNFNLMAKPDVTLETIHRNAGEIAHFAEHLRKGMEPKLYKPKTDAVRFSNTPSKEYGNVDQMICAFNEKRVQLNHAERSRRGFKTDQPEVNDRIICLHNMRQYEVFNGMQGTVTALGKQNIETRWGLKEVPVLTFVGDDGLTREVPYMPEQFNQPKKLDWQEFEGRVPFDFAYAITAHKSQGSEIDRVMVFDQYCKLWSMPRWRYTSATRAKKSLIWV